MTFYKIKKKGRNLDDAYWVTESINKYGEIWVNLRGGWCMKSADDEIVAVAEYADEDEFTSANRKDVYSYLIKPKSDYGWLAPDGTFYGCDYASHNDVACFYFDKDDLELEKEGWIKIFRSFESGEAVYSQLKISTQQRIFLEDRGIEYAYC
jgi:hypothetical protein